VLNDISLEQGRPALPDAGSGSRTSWGRKREAGCTDALLGMMSRLRVLAEPPDRARRGAIGASCA
jgi:hypothetical protein